jgi:hypothetical protein
MGKDKYSQFKPALTAGLTKIEDYYNKTSLADAYTMTMSEFYPSLALYRSLLSIYTST